MYGACTKRVSRFAFKLSTRYFFLFEPTDEPRRSVRDPYLGPIDVPGGRTSETESRSEHERRHEMTSRRVVTSGAIVLRQRAWNANFAFERPHEIIAAFDVFGGRTDGIRFSVSSVRYSTLLDRKKGCVGENKKKIRRRRKGSNTPRTVPERRRGQLNIILFRAVYIRYVVAPRR